MIPVGGPTMRGGLVLVVALVVGALSGCSDDATTLDRAATERAVGEVVAGRVTPEVVRTRCPEEIPLGEGEIIDCAVTLAATVGSDDGAEPTSGDDGADAPAEVEARLRVRVTQVDDDGTLDVVLRDAVLDLDAVVLDLEARLKERFERSFDASCGAVAHRVVAPKGTFSCRARDKAGPRTVSVTVVDAAGTLRYDVLS